MTTPNDAVPTHEHIALIGAGPSGLAGARNLQKHGVPFQGFEAHGDVGGLWDISNPHSTVYHSADAQRHALAAFQREAPRVHPHRALAARQFEMAADEPGGDERARSS